jgi:hypothetical protein
MHDVAEEVALEDKEEKFNISSGEEYKRQLTNPKSQHEGETSSK